VNGNAREMNGAASFPQHEKKKYDYSYLFSPKHSLFEKEIN